MAITLDELLNRNTETTETVDRFPSYENFRASRSEMRQDAPVLNNRYANMGAAPQSYAEPVRNYEAPVRPYIAPSTREYRQPQNEDLNGYPVANDGYGMRNGAVDAANTYYAPQENFYSFNVNDPESKSPQELLNMLDSNASDPYAPAFEDTAREQAMAKRQAEMQQLKKQKARGIIVIALYLAAAITLAVLIGVNAKSINKGKAVVPSSHISVVATEQK